MTLESLKKRAEKIEKSSFYDFLLYALECSELVKKIKPIKRKAWIKHMIKEILEEQNHKCAICSCDISLFNLEVDHVIPHSKGGGNERGNLQLTCKKCNRSKGTKVDPKELVRYLENRYMNL